MALTTLLEAFVYIFQLFSKRKNPEDGLDKPCPTLLYNVEKPKNQRWASTLANRSNARHRSNIRAPPPHPHPPPRCMYPKCRNLCCQKGQEAVHI